MTKEQCEVALEGERSNMTLARQSVQELGGVPFMLAPFDSTNVPEEKVGPSCKSSLGDSTVRISWPLRDRRCVV